MAEKTPRIPGMAWTAIAFIPWILYWVLAGMGYTTAAILSGLTVSLLINSYRFAIRKVKILDAITLAFLALSAFVTIVRCRLPENRIGALHLSPGRGG